MLNADRAVVFEECERCGEHGFERLANHGHCVNCNFFEDYTTEVRWKVCDWAIGLFR
jgi:hypothetical protein